MEDVYYRVYKEDGSFHSYYRATDALREYHNFNGTKIATVTKDLFPTITVVINEPGLDPERIRKDLTVKQTTEAMRRAVAKYDKENTKQVTLKLNKNTDKELIEFLDGLENKQGFIKELIKKEMLKCK